MPQKTASQAMINPIWDGEKCYIIGGGPSVKDLGDLDYILSDELVIAVNDAYTFECADVCFFGDSAWYSAHKDKEEFKNCKATIITNNPSGKQFGPEVVWTKRMTSGLSTEPDKIAFNGNSGAAAINMALLLGVSRIYLIGFDMKTDEDGNTNWHNDNITEVPKRKYKSYINKMDKMRELILQKFPSVKIFNCNPDSALDTFPKMSLNESFKEVRDDGIELNDQVDGYGVINDNEVPVILTVLKSGGEFETKHVLALKKQLDEHVTIDYKFYCFTDLPLKGNYILPLTEDLPGWHSKLEMFKHIFNGPVTYFDLDTVILQNIDEIIAHDSPFAGLQDFYREKHFASGMMQWAGDLTFMWPKLKKITACIKRMHWKQVWDQRLIAKVLADCEIPWERVQELYPFQIRSWKKNRLFDGIPEDCKVICFHGIPRPWAVEQFKHLYEF